MRRGAGAVAAPGDPGTGVRDVGGVRSGGVAGPWVRVSERESNESGEGWPSRLQSRERTGGAVAIRCRFLLKVILQEGLAIVVAHLPQCVLTFAADGAAIILRRRGGRPMARVPKCTVLGRIVSLAVLLTAFAVESAPGDVIQACFKRKSGNLRLPPAGKTCRKSESPISWSPSVDGTPAGGVLQGTYPDPALRDGAVTISKLQAGLWGVSLAMYPSIGAHACWAFSADDVAQSPVLNGDLVVPDASGYPAGLFPVPTVAPADRKVTLVMCNGTDTPIQPPPFTQTNFRVVR
jgi:hypothetical protein